VIVIKKEGKGDRRGVAFVQSVKKPKDRSGKNTEHYGLPVFLVEAQNVEYRIEKAHLITARDLDLMK
jgi:hypothetical protein